MRPETESAPPSKDPKASTSPRPGGRSGRPLRHSSGRATRRRPETGYSSSRCTVLPSSSSRTEPVLARCTTKGRPGAVMELIHLLVDDGELRFENGAWSLPRELPEARLPERVRDEIMGLD